MITRLRQEYHQRICQEIIRAPGGYPNFADKSSKASKNIAWGIVGNLGSEIGESDVKEQTAGERFETITKDYLEASLSLLQHLRPGDWVYSTKQTSISGFDQYEHLEYLDQVISKDKSLASALGGDYIVKPDIIIARQPVSDDQINQFQPVIHPGDPIAIHTSLRRQDHPNPRPMLHASISCKWTIRSDRSQNTRTEALNLIRNRKGNLPHIVAVTAEPLPTRIAALALGTGDLDCVYHFALLELEAAVKDIRNEDQLDMLYNMIYGRRLRDISDLPFDLAI